MRGGDHKRPTRNLPVNSKIYTIHQLIFAIAYDVADSHDKLHRSHSTSARFREAAGTGGIIWAEESDAFAQQQRGIWSDGLWSETQAAQPTGREHAQRARAMSRERGPALNAFATKLLERPLSRSVRRPEAHRGHAGEETNDPPTGNESRRRVRMARVRTYEHRERRCHHPTGAGLDGRQRGLGPGEAAKQAPIVILAAEAE